MQGQTHRVGGVLAALAGYTILESNGLLISNINPLLQLAIIYPFAVYGSVLPDLDHHWDSCPSKDVVSFGINKFLHIGRGLEKMGLKKFGGAIDAKHRSWQTHSLILLMGMVVALWFTVKAGAETANIVIIKLMLSGLILGVLSHLILDAITPQGIWLLIPSMIRRKKTTLHLVPRTKFFATGNRWEDLIKILLWVAIIVLIVRMLYLVSPYRISFNIK